VSGSISVDFETRGTADLKKVGAFRYANDPSTEIICAALSRDDGEPLIWVNSKFGQSDPGVDDLVKEWLYGDCLIYAHNAQFEQAIFEALCPRYFGFGNPWKMRPRWRCTAAMARKAALPSSLEKCAAVLGLKQQKDKRGGALIRKFCIPDPDTGEFVNPADHPDDFRALLDYCKQDVRTEQEIHQALKAFELTGLSLRTFLMDYVINARGLPVNVESASRAREVVNQAVAALEPEFQQITGLNPTQGKKLLPWLQERGYKAANLQGKTIEEVLEEEADGEEELPEEVKRVLQIKRMLSFAANSKLDRMVEMAGPRDNRVRGSLIYHGATTGRWTAEKLQPQNMKKPSAALGKFTKEIYAKLGSGITCEEIDFHYGNPVEAVASCIRHFIHDQSGPMFAVDYAAIEARIVCWLAGQDDVVELFRTGQDLYRVMAGEIYGLTAEQVKKLDKAGYERQLGKEAVLGCGFGLGIDGFVAACQRKGIKITKELATRAVEAFRASRYKVKDMWYECERGFLHAMTTGSPYKVNDRISFSCGKVANGRFVFAHLPSGRRLSYPFPRRERVASYTEKGKKKTVIAPTVEQLKKITEIDPKVWVKDSLTYAGFPQGSSVWGRVTTYGGSLVENITQAVAADIMCHGCLNAEEAGYQTATLIHDEWLGYKLPGQTAERLIELLTDLPPWADGLPIKAEGGEVPYYLKE
jgi:DNA polymerase